jgi:hypothetical protein
MKRRTLVIALLLACVPLITRAHEGMIHVMGVVTAIKGKSVTVATTDKMSVEVVVVDSTTYAKDKKPAVWSDLKVGDRVVIHAVKINGALQAHTVDFNDGTR